MGPKCQGCNVLEPNLKMTGKTALLTNSQEIWTGTKCARSQIGPKAKVSLSQADEAEEARLVILQAPTKLSD